MVGRSCIYLLVLLWLLDIVDQRLSPRVKLLHFWYVLYAVVVWYLTIILGACNKDIDKKTSTMSVMYSTAVDVLTDLMSKSTLVVTAPYFDDKQSWHYLYDYCGTSASQPLRRKV
jgi:hypothetical protein